WTSVAGSRIRYASTSGWTAEDRWSGTASAEDVSGSLVAGAVVCSSGVAGLGGKPTAPAACPAWREVPDSGGSLARRFPAFPAYPVYPPLGCPGRGRLSYAGPHSGQ